MEKSKKHNIEVNEVLADAAYSIQENLVMTAIEVTTGEVSDGK